MNFEKYIFKLNDFVDDIKYQEDLPFNFFEVEKIPHDLIIYYNDIPIKLYSIQKAALVSKMSYTTFVSMVRSGRIAAPYFFLKKNGVYKIYFNEFELRVLNEAFVLFGFFGSQYFRKITGKLYKTMFLRFSSYFFRDIFAFIYIYVKFNEIKKNLTNKIVPDVSVILQFQNRQVFENSLKKFMLENNIFSVYLFDKFKNFFYEHEFVKYKNITKVDKLFTRKSKDWLFYIGRKISEGAKRFAQFISLLPNLELEKNTNSEVDNFELISEEFFK